MLTFEESTHTYMLGDKVIPSVTQCLQKLHSFGMVPADVLEAACLRGTHVHAICEFYDEGDLDYGTIGPYGGYLEAWVQFCTDYEVQWDAIEERGYSTRFGYAGTLDRRGTLRKQPAKWIVDIKTGTQLHRVCGMQLAAYRQIVAETQDPAYLLARRGTVQLASDGKYKFIEWKSPTDWTAYQALLTLTNWSNS